MEMDKRLPCVTSSPNQISCEMLGSMFDIPADLFVRSQFRPFSQNARNFFPTSPFGSCVTAEGSGDTNVNACCHARPASNQSACAECKKKYINREEEGTRCCAWIKFRRLVGGMLSGMWTGNCKTINHNAKSFNELNATNFLLFTLLFHWIEIDYKTLPAYRIPVQCILRKNANTFFCCLVSFIYKCICAIAKLQMHSTLQHDICGGKCCSVFSFPCCLSIPFGRRDNNSLIPS